MLSTRQQRQGEAPEKLFLVTMIQDKPHTNLGFAAKETVFEFQLSQLFIFPYLHKPFHPLRRKISTDIRTRGDQGVGEYFFTQSPLEARCNFRLYENRRNSL